MLIYGKNVAVEKLKTQDKINKIYFLFLSFSLYFLGISGGFPFDG